MLKLKSLTAKLIFMGAIMLVFLTIYITAGFIFTHHMSDEGTRINLAGQLRYRSFEMAWLVRRIIKTGDTGLRDSAVMELKEKMNQFERTAKSIKNGDKEIGIRPLKYEKGLVILEKFFNEWDTTLKPMLLEMTESSEEKARILLDKYESRIQGYVSEIDGFVSFLGNDYKKDLKDFDKFRFYTLGFFFIATAFVIFYARSSVIKPVWKLKDAAREIEKGNLDVRVDIKGEDEIGLLGKAFNSMVLTRKQEEDQLRKLSLAVEQSPNTVVITDIQGNIEYVNPRFTEITGYLPGEVIGKNPKILKSGKTPHGIYKELWETITSGGLWRGEWQNMKKNGEIYWASVIISPIKVKNGRITHFLAEEVDITERKNAEEALRENNERLEEQFRIVAMAKQEWQDTFDNITELIFIHDRDFRILRANRAFGEYFGLSPTEMIGKNCHELFFGKDSPVLSCPYNIALNEGREVTTEVFIPRSNTIFRISSFPFYTSERNIQSFICIAKDITEEKEKEMRLVMSERLASLGHVASGIAHEISNPIATISGCAEGLLLKIRKGQIDPDFFESYLRMIEEEVLRCKDITTGMLSFVRKTTYEKMDININELLDETLKVIGFHSRLQDVEVNKNYAIAMPHIYANKGELRQVFLIIITNAIDAMDDKATITLETGTENDNTVFIKISDTGHGIPSENRDRIFDPFFTTKSDKGGTGLGLAIAHKIITNHNGNIEVISESGKGTTFKIILPVSQS